MGAPWECFNYNVTTVEFSYYDILLYLLGPFKSSHWRVCPIISHHQSKTWPIAKALADSDLNWSPWVILHTLFLLGIFQVKSEFVPVILHFLPNTMSGVSTVNSTILGRTKTNILLHISYFSKSVAQNLWGWYTLHRCLNTWHFSKACTLQKGMLLWSSFCYYQSSMFVILVAWMKSWNMERCRLEPIAQ